MKTVTSHRLGIIAAALLPLMPLHAVRAQSHDHRAHEGHQADRTQPQAPAMPPEATGTDDGSAHPEMDHSQMDHAKMDHSGMGHTAMGHEPPADSQPKTPIPPITEADRVAANRPLKHHMAHGGGLNRFQRFDRLETWNAEHGAGLHWEAEGWVGTDTDRLWLRSEGEREGGRTESADLELLYGRSLSPWWDVVAGVRQDFKPGGSRTFAAIGIMGLAPQKFEVEATLYAGEEGQTALVLEAERELLLTNRMILQPMAEAEFHGKTERERGIGSGLGGIELGLRLRYEVTRRFAPYVGIVHERAFGTTANLRREEGESVEDTRVIAGIRFWF